MSKHIMLLLMLCMLPALACNLTSSGDDDDAGRVPTIPVNPGPFATATPTVLAAFPTATPTLRPTNTPIGQDPGGGTGGVPVFSDMSFSTTAGGAPVTTFRLGTQEVYVRWSYNNIPSGALMTRQWYRDGVLVASNQENWSASWGSSGRLTHIKLFDYQSGLTPGNYYVLIRLPSYGTQIDARFTIAAEEPIFDALTFSRTQGGAAADVFPYGTEEIYARWNYVAVTPGSIMRRFWYRDGQLIIQREEAWRVEWGSHGTLSHIRLYDFNSGYGLEPGNYTVVIDLRDFPSARVENSFVVEPNVGPGLSTLRFAESGNGEARTQFDDGTLQVFAIFNYSNLPVGAQLRQIWKRDGATILDESEPWNFDTYGTSGTRRDVAISNQNGLPNGDYEVELSIVGQPGVVVRGNFSIGTPPVPVFNSLSFGTTPTSTAQTVFPAGTTQVYARWNYANIPNGETLQIQWLHNGVIVRTDTAVWSVGTNGTHSSDIFVDSGLQSGNWSVQVDLLGFDQASVSGNFAVEAPADPELSNAGLSDTKGGTVSASFPHDVGNLFVQFDFTNVPSATPIQATLVSAEAGVNLQLDGSWTYVSSGRVTDLWIGDPTQPLPPGTYQLSITLPDYGKQLDTSFTIEAPPGGNWDPATVDYYVPPQIDPDYGPDPPIDGLWADYTLL